MKILLLPAILLLSLTFVNAQIPEPPSNIPSPNAYSFTQKTNMPVSHFTGTTQVNIPLAEGKYKDLAIPIGLSYNYTGFRPEQHPGSVGMGWNLDVGGVITRIVKGGFPDEFEFELTPNPRDYPNEKYPTRNGALVNNIRPNVSSLTSAFPLINRLLSSLPILYRPDISAYTLVEIPNKLPYHPNQPTRPSPQGYAQTVKWGPFPGSSPATFWFYSSGRLDAFWDEFSFNFMGFSGKFILHSVGINNGYPLLEVQSDQKVKIEMFEERLKVPFLPVTSQHIGPYAATYMNYYSPYFEEGKYPKTISGFAITTENGYKYFFGKNAEMLTNNTIQDPTNEYFNSVAIEYSISANEYATDIWTADAWHLTRILCPDGKKIDYEYERKDFILQENRSLFVNGGADFSYSRSARINSPVYLKNISSDFFNCDFFNSKTNELRPSMQTYNYVENRDFCYYINQPSDQINWYKLDSIRLSGIGVGLKSFRFDYNNLSTERLFLKKITQINGEERSNFHEFTYNTSKVLPTYLTAQTDHWGYWNGKARFDLNYTNLTDFLISKEPDFSFTTAGSLTKIKYPTGGEVSFEYDQNTYSKYVPEIRTQPLVSTSNSFTGGQRIKKVSHYDPVVNATKTKKYFYTNAYNPLLSDNDNRSANSSGVNTRINKYKWNFNGASYHNLDFISAYSGDYYVLSDQSLISTPDSYNVNYTNVYEVETNNGYTYYKYTNFDNGHGDEDFIFSINNVVSPYSRFSSKSLERGRLLELSNFNQANDTVSKTLYSYKADYLVDGELPFAYRDDGQAFPGMSALGYLLNPVGTIFKVYLYRYVKDKEINYSFNQGKRIKNFKQYFYDNPTHGQISRIKQLKSNGDTLITKFTYGADYTGFLPGRLVGSHQLNTIIDKKTIVKDTSTKIERIISAELYEYKLNPNYSQDTWLKAVYGFEAATAIPSNEYAGFTINNIDWNAGPWTKDSRYRELISYDKYDELKNPLIFAKNGGPKSSILYNRSGTLPILILSNKTYQNVAYNSFEEPQSMWSLSREPSPLYFKTGEKSFKGVANIKVPTEIGFPNCYIDLWAMDGVVPSVSWGSTSLDNVNSLGTPVTLLSLGNWTLYRYTTPNNHPMQGIKIDSNGTYIDEVRIYSPGSSLQSYTYGKNGLLLNINDDRNMITTYEYDAFQRFKYVKDQNGNIVKAHDYHYKP